MTFLSLGMDIHQLRFELCSGIRLPTQSHFPSNTSKLIKECFHEDPYQRPNFKKIKKDIAIAYNELLQNVYLKVGVDVNEVPSQYAVLSQANEANCDPTKKRYMDIKQKNEEAQTRKSVSSNNEKSKYEKHTSSSLHYLSLGNAPDPEIEQLSPSKFPDSIIPEYDLNPNDIGSPNNRRNSIDTSILKCQTFPRVGSLSENRSINVSLLNNEQRGIKSLSDIITMK